MKIIFIIAICLLVVVTIIIIWRGDYKVEIQVQEKR